MAHTPFACRILAAAVRLVAYPTRGFLLAIGADPAAAVALGVLLVSVCLCLPLAWKALILSGRWVDRRLDAHRQQRDRRAFDDIVEHYGDRFPDDDAEPEPGVTHLGHTPPPPGRRRRMPRIPGRPRGRRRTTTSSSSDRRH